MSLGEASSQSMIVLSVFDQRQVLAPTSCADLASGPASDLDTVFSGAGAQSQCATSTQVALKVYGVYVIKKSCRCCSIGSCMNTFISSDPRLGTEL